MFETVFFKSSKFILLFLWRWWEGRNGRSNLDSGILLDSWTRHSIEIWVQPERSLWEKFDSIKAEFPYLRAKTRFSNHFVSRSQKKATIFYVSRGTASCCTKPEEFLPFSSSYTISQKHSDFQWNSYCVSVEVKGSKNWLSTSLLQTILIYQNYSVLLNS